MKSLELRRAGRRTNLGLLFTLLGAFGTGWLAFAAGTPVPSTLARLSHGLFGLGVIVLLPWKSVIIRRATTIRPAALALLVLLGICLGAGLVQLLGGFGVRRGVSPIQVHVGAALIAVPLLLVHVLRRRRQRVRRSDASRRTLLAGALGLAGAGAGLVALEGLAGVTRPTRPRTTTGSRRLNADAIPATIWLLDDIPRLDPAAHRVEVAGTRWSVTDLAARARPVAARLDCTSGWYADAIWTAVPVADLLTADALAAASSLEVRSVTGYRRRFPVADAGALWLATGCQGRPLTVGTGAPVRLVAPGRRGFWWVKWVASIRLSDAPAGRQLPFPAQ